MVTASGAKPLGREFKSHVALYQMDVKSAFWNGEIQEEIYVKPPGFINPKKPNHVYKLNKDFLVQMLHGVSFEEWI